MVIQSEARGHSIQSPLVKHRNSCRSWHISCQNVWPWFLTPRGHSRSNLTVSIETCGSYISVSALVVQPRICHRFQDILNQRIVTLTYNLSRSSKVESMRSLYNLSWVRHRNCSRSWYIWRQNVWPWFLTPQGHPRSSLTMAIESPWALHISAPWVQRRICHRFRDISSQSFYCELLTLNRLTPRPKVTKSGDDLPATQVYHPAKFQPNRANGLRDMRYQSFSLFGLGGLTSTPVVRTGVYPHMPIADRRSPRNK